MNSDLCQTCQNIFRTVERSKSPQRFAHHSDWSALSSAARRCHVCFIIQNAFYKGPENHYGRGLDAVQMKIDFSACENEDWPLGKVHVEWIRAQGDICGVREFTLRAASNSQPILGASVAQSSTDSPLSMAQAVKWIEDCTNSHQSCPKSRDCSFLPTRILDLGSPRDTSVIVLREREEIPKDARYITLSHCWGGKLEKMLNLFNLASFRKEVTHNDLSQTYLDAIKISRLIGIRYLWIDSLCIIQDSQSDWEAECVHMSSVYANAFCNIAASAASDGSQGCFMSRDRRAINPCEVLIPSKNNGVCQLYEFTQDHNVDWKYLDNSPLNRRAWVLQERLLSPRVLHFGPQQLLWECDELTASESFPTGHGPTKGVEYRIQPSLSSASSPSQLFGATDYWQWVVESYSQSSLSRDSDRVVALSGLVQKSREYVDDSCVVGLWIRYLELQLCWRMWNPARARLTIAPTWSWMSVYGQVRQTILASEFGSKASEEDDIRVWLLAEVLAREDIIARANVFGELHGSRVISVRCFMFPSSWEKDQHFPWGTDVILVSAQGTRHTIAHISWDVAKDLRGPCYWLVPIFIHQGNLYGLVLEACISHMETFKRLGSFQSDWRSNEKWIRTACSNDWSARGKSEAWMHPGQEKPLLAEELRTDLEFCDLRYQHVLSLV